MLMPLGQDFPTPNPLFHDQRHTGKIPSTFDGIYNVIHPMAVTAPAGGKVPGWVLPWWEATEYDHPGRAHHGTGLHAPSITC